MNVVKEFTEYSLLEQIAQEINSIEDLKDNDLTVPRLVKLTPRRSRAYVERLLRDKADAGELIVVECRDPKSGRRVQAYRLPQ